MPLRTTPKASPESPSSHVGWRLKTRLVYPDALELEHVRDRFSPPSPDQIADWMVDRFSADATLAKRFSESLALHWGEKFSDSARLSIPLIESATRGLLLTLQLARMTGQPVLAATNIRNSRVKSVRQYTRSPFVTPEGRIIIVMRNSSIGADGERYGVVYMRWEPSTTTMK